MEQLLSPKSAREAACLTQAELGAAVGLSQSGVSKIERAESWPDQEARERIALALGRDVAEIAWRKKPTDRIHAEQQRQARRLFRRGASPKVVAHELDIPIERAYDYRHRFGFASRRSEAVPGRPVHIVRAAEKAELENHRLEGEWLSTHEIAALVPCHPTTVRKYARRLRSRHVAQRYPGPWTANERPWLFRLEALGVLREFLAETHAQRRERVRTTMVDRHARGVHRGRPREGRPGRCDCGCGRVVYRPPSHRLTHVFATRSCTNIWRFDESRRYSDEANLEPLVRAGWPGSARQHFLGTRYGHLGAQAGIEAAYLGLNPGPPPKATPDEQNEMRRLLDEGNHTLREIADRVFGDESLYARVYRFKHQQPVS